MSAILSFLYTLAFDERLWNRIAPIKYLLSNLLHAFQSNRSHFLRSLNCGVHITSMWDWCITMEKNNMLYANCEAKCLLAQSLDTIYSLVYASAVLCCAVLCYAICSIQFVWLRWNRLGSSSSFICLFVGSEMKQMIKTSRREGRRRTGRVHSQQNHLHNFYEVP